MFVTGDPTHNARSHRVKLDVGGKVHELSRPRSGWYTALKCLIDFVVGCVLLAFSVPVLLVACLVVKLTSGGPAFYCQTRLGRRGKPYTIYKIRTMTHNCENHSGVCWAQPNDTRVTPVGRWLRRTHIDELPQLWNVLRGEMSLVGPRPERPEFVPGLAHAIPRYAERLLVRPGMTGLAQVQLPPDTDVESVRRKLAYDLYYVNRLGFWLDCRILVCTAFYVLRFPLSFRRRILRLPHGNAVEHVFQGAKPKTAAPVPELNPV